MEPFRITHDTFNQMDIRKDIIKLEEDVSKIQPKVKGYLNLAEYNPVGDGVTDDTQAVKDAIAHAKANSFIVRVPDQTYLITSDIPDFWDVSFEGVGRIKFDSDIWYFDNGFGLTNTIYVSETNGLDTNSGMSSSAPLKSLAKVGGVLKRLGDKAQKGQWKVRLLGSFTDGATFDNLPDFAYPLIFEGDKNTDGTPATNISYTSGKSQFGMRFEPAKHVTVYNINFKDFKVGFNGYGLIAKDHGNVFVDNCTADNCDIGFAFINNCVGSIRGSKATNCTNGFNGTYSSSVTFGYNGKPAEAINCGTGFYISRSAIAHVDYCIATDATVAGVHIDVNARAHVLGSHFKRNDIGVRIDGGAEWNNNPTTPNNFYEGTVDANGVNYKHNGGGRESRLYSIGTQVEYRIKSDITERSHTGSTSEHVFIAYSNILPANFFTEPNKRFRAVVKGKFTGTALKTLYLRSTNNTGGENVVIGGASTTSEGDFEFDSTLIPIDSATQKRQTKLITYDGTPRGIHSESAMVTSNERYVRLTAVLADATNQIDIQSIEFYLMG